MIKAFLILLYASFFLSCSDATTGDSRDRKYPELAFWELKSSVKFQEEKFYVPKKDGVEITSDDSDLEEDFRIQFKYHLSFNRDAMMKESKFFQEDKLSSKR